MLSNLDVIESEIVPRRLPDLTVGWFFNRIISKLDKYTKQYERLFIQGYNQFQEANTQYWLEKNYEVRETENV